MLVKKVVVPLTVKMEEGRGCNQTHTHGEVVDACLKTGIALSTGYLDGEQEVVRFILVSDLEIKTVCVVGPIVFEEWSVMFFVGSYCNHHIEILDAILTEC